MTMDAATVVPQRPAAIPALTGLRIVGAVWVLLFHLQPTLYAAWTGFKIFEPVLKHGDSGVALFFVLSGFIIWHNYGALRLLTPRAAVRFVWRRFARLWPVNLLTAALSVPLVWWVVVQLGNWGDPVPEWFTVQGWMGSAFMLGVLGEPTPVFPWNQPAWTLTAEMISYLLFPLMVLGLAGRMRVGTWVWTLAGILLALAVELVPLSVPFWWLLRLVPIFVAGVLLRVGLRSMPGRVMGVLQVLAPVLLLLVCYAGLPFLLTPLLALWVWSLSADGGPFVRLFSTRPFLIAGLSSYSLYMLHWVLFGYAHLWLYYNASLESGLLPVFVVVVVFGAGAAAYLCWRFFESPAREIVNRLFERAWVDRARERLDG